MSGLRVWKWSAVVGGASSRIRRCCCSLNNAAARISRPPSLPPLWGSWSGSLHTCDRKLSDLRDYFWVCGTAPPSLWWSAVAAANCWDQRGRLGYLKAPPSSSHGTEHTKRHHHHHNNKALWPDGKFQENCVFFFFFFYMWKKADGKKANTTGRTFCLFNWRCPIPFFFFFYCQFHIWSQLNARSSASSCIVTFKLCEILV